jgi:hypothetical protein
MNTVICSQIMAHPDPHNGSVFAEIDIDFSGRFEQGKIVQTTEVLDTVWGESQIMSFRTMNSVYVVDAKLYHSNLIIAEEKGFPIPEKLLAWTIDFSSPDHS